MFLVMLNRVYFHETRDKEPKTRERGRRRIGSGKGEKLLHTLYIYMYTRNTYHLESKVYFRVGSLFLQWIAGV